MPAMNAVGTNTDMITSVNATIGPDTSSIAFFDASTGDRPSSFIRRSTFSTTTIASSTTMPIASTRPNIDRLFSEKPNIDMPANVPTSDTGTATIGITVVRQSCRKISVTRNTSTNASNSVCTTPLIDSSTNTVVS